MKQGGWLGPSQGPPGKPQIILTAEDIIALDPTSQRISIIRRGKTIQTFPVEQLDEDEGTADA